MTARQPAPSRHSSISRRRFLLGAGAAVASTHATAAQTPVPIQNVPLLRIAVSRLPDGMDPTTSTHPDHLWLDTLVLDSPNRWNANGMVLAAITHQVSGSTSDEEFDLVVRPGALFHTGRPVNADDVRYTLERIRNGGGGRQHAWRLEHVRSLRTVGETTLHVTLERPDASLAASLAHQVCGILPAGTDPIDLTGGTGPFVLRVADAEQMFLDRNPYFWQFARPRIDTLQVVPIQDDARRATSIAQGEIDVLPNVPLLDIPMLRDDPTSYLAGGPSNRVCLLQVNLASTAMGDARVRRLISRAIDRERLVGVATAGQATPTGLLFPAESWVGGAVEEVDALSPDAIREELRLLGIPTDLRVRLLTNNADATLANTAIVLQEQLAACGIALSVDLLEDDELEEAIRLGDYDLLAAYTEPWRDPHELVRPLLMEDGSRNRSGYTDERVATLVRGAILREDRPFRRERYALIERAVQEDAPVIVLFHPHSYDAVSTRVAGYTTLPPVTSRGLLTVQPGAAPDA